MLSWACATLRDHTIDYWRLRICINKIKITDYKDYERLHWDYRPSVRDYSHVADPSPRTLGISQQWTSLLAWKFRCLTVKLLGICKTKTQSHCTARRRFVLKTRVKTLKTRLNCGNKQEFTGFNVYHWQLSATSNHSIPCYTV